MSSYLLVLFFLSYYQRGYLSVHVEELFRFSGRLHFPWAGWLCGAERSTSGHFISQCQWEQEKHTHKRTLVPTNVRSVKSMKLSFPILVTRFHILSSANPPPASRRGIPTWSCPTSRISKVLCVHLALSECIARDSVTFPEGPAAPRAKATAAITAASLGLAQSQSEQNGGESESFHLNHKTTREVAR